MIQPEISSRTSSRIQVGSFERNKGGGAGQYCPYLTKMVKVSNFYFRCYQLCGPEEWLGIEQKGEGLIVFPSLHC